VSGVLVRNNQPRRSFDHSSVLQRCFVSASLGSSLMASATMLNEPEHAVALVWANPGRFIAA